MKPTAKDVGRLRRRIDALVAELGDEFPKLVLSRALMATATDIGLSAAGSLSTVHALQRNLDLLGGRWSDESITYFILSPNH